MAKMIAHCGLVCSGCPAYLATLNDDDAAREKAAAFYAKKYGFDLKPEDINCDGCLTEGGRKLGYCRTCEIRKCCREKGLENCAICNEQPCEKLQKLHDFSSYAKEAFDDLVSRKFDEE